MKKKYFFRLKIVIFRAEKIAQGSRGLLIRSPRTPICGLGLLFFLEIYQNHHMGLHSGLASWDTYFEIPIEIPLAVYCISMLL